MEQNQGLMVRFLNIIIAATVGIINFRIFAWGSWKQNFNLGKKLLATFYFYPTLQLLFVYLFRHKIPRDFIRIYGDYLIAWLHVI